MTASELAHDLIAAGLLIFAMCGTCKYARAEIDRLQRARRIFRAWRRV